MDENSWASFWAPNFSPLKFFTRNNSSWFIYCFVNIFLVFLHAHRRKTRFVSGKVSFQLVVCNKWSFLLFAPFMVLFNLKCIAKWQEFMSIKSYSMRCEFFVVLKSCLNNYIIFHSSRQMRHIRHIQYTLESDTIIASTWKHSIIQCSLSFSLSPKTGWKSSNCNWKMRC